MITVTLFFAGFTMLALTLFTIKNREYRIQLIVCASSFIAILTNTMVWQIFEDGEIIFKNFSDGRTSDKLGFILAMIGAILVIISLKLRMNVVTKRKNTKKLS